MIGETEYLASKPPAQPIPDNDVAVSIRAPWEVVSNTPGLEVPLRRPARRESKREIDHVSLETELQAWDAASDEAWESIDD